MSSLGKDYTISVDDIQSAEWNRLLSGFDDATIYQTWAYGEISWGRDQLSHLVLRQAGEAVGMAQLRLVRVPVLNCGVAYVRWGPLWRRKGLPADINALRQITTAIQEEYVGRRGLMLRMVPNAFQSESPGPEIAAAWEEMGFQKNDESRPYRTICVDLTPPLDVIRKRFDGKWRNQLNRAEKNGLTVHAGTSDELYATFKALYDEMMARKQFETTVDVDEFRRIQQALPEELKMRILVTELNGKPMTALVASTIGDTGIYLLGATSDEGMTTKGSYLNQWLMMSYLKEKGCTRYDLGGINPESNPGVYHFKWGMSGSDVTHIGQFEDSRKMISSKVVRWGESLKRLRRDLSSSTPAATGGK